MQLIGVFLQDDKVSCVTPPPIVSSYHGIDSEGSAGWWHLLGHRATSLRDHINTTPIGGTLKSLFSIVILFMFCPAETKNQQVEAEDISV